MKLSLNWISQYTKVDMPVDELVQKIGAQLGEVEGVENLGPKYAGAVIVQVKTCENHPDADRLHILTIDDGGITPDVKRDANGLVQVVCGAPNVKADMLAVWLPPRATVPDSFDKEPFTLEARELRGVVSNGMLASPKELALGDSHEGILEIDPSEWSPKQSEIKPGASFARTFGLDDTVIDIENKMFTHRPDLFGELGLAREIAGITGQQFQSPKWYADPADFPVGSGLTLKVINETPELVPRFTALAIKNVTVKPSPLWLQCALLSVGQKPINNVVDVTNYIMLLTAQPTHAYDYDKVRGHTLVARTAKPSETITLLNHKEYTLDPADIVIADGEGAIGLGGVMGGGDCEVSDDTKNIILECATFDMYAVRRSSMRHGLFTDALTRFNKGQSPLQTRQVLHLLMQSVFDVAGGEVGSEVFDHNTLKDRDWVHPPVPVTTGFINARLGLALTATEMKTLLENVEMKVELDDDRLTVSAPFWRTDIESREDIVEEVGRLYGYDHLPLELPQRSIKPAPQDTLLILKGRLRDMLQRAGANEILTYSFVHGNLLEKTGQNPDKAFRLSNALSPDLQYYRLSLTPSLLDKVHPNLKAGYDDFCLFEIGKSHCVGEWDTDEPNVPNEDEHLALVVAANDKHRPAGGAYYRARKYFEALCPDLVTDLVPLTDFDLENDEWGKQLTAPYEPNRTAVIVRDNQVRGVVGEFKPSVSRALKLPAYMAGLELHLSVLPLEQRRYVPLSRFPSVRQDITLRVAATTRFQELQGVIEAALKTNSPEATDATVEPLGIYQSEEDTTKNVSFRVSILPHNRTLTEQEASATLETIAAAAHDKLGAERV